MPFVLRYGRRNVYVDLLLDLLGFVKGAEFFWKNHGFDPEVLPSMNFFLLLVYSLDKKQISSEKSPLANFHNIDSLSKKKVPAYQDGTIISNDEQ